MAQVMVPILAKCFNAVSPDATAFILAAAASILCREGQYDQSSDSTSFHLLPLLETLRPDKRSWMNDNVLKNSLGITLALLASLHACVESVHGGGDARAMLRPATRLTLAFFNWLCVTCVFQHVQDETQVDLSGHMFLQGLLILMILEECSRAAKFLVHLKSEVEEEVQVRAGVSDQVTALAHLDIPTFELLVGKVKSLEPAFIGLLALSALLLIVFLWNYMLTCLFFHSVFEKEVGLAVGLASWACLYKLVVPVVNAIQPSYHIFDFH